MNSDLQGQEEGKEEEHAQNMEMYNACRTEMLCWLPRYSVGAEIGTWQGEYAQEMIEICKPRVLHLIDPYQYFPEYPNRWYGGSVATSQVDMDKIYEDVRDRLEKISGNETSLNFHRDLSENAITGFKENELDWAYIDGNHSYEYVKKDLEGLMSKIKPGGFIMGDDLHWPGITQAVREFIGENQESLVVVTKFPRANQYVLKKL